MNPEEVLSALQELRLLPYFPAENEHIWSSLVRLCGQMCDNLEQVRWLVARMTSGIYAQWPGPHEMRACFCCRYKPKDGISAYSTCYPDGLPPDPTAPPRALEAPARLALPPGHVASRDAELDGKLQNLANAKSMRRVMQRANPEPISPQRRAELQAMINRAERENREKKARQEL